MVRAAPGAGGRWLRQGQRSFSGEVLYISLYQVVLLVILMSLSGWLGFGVHYISLSLVRALSFVVQVSESNGPPPRRLRVSSIAAYVTRGIRFSSPPQGLPGTVSG